MFVRLQATEMRDDGGMSVCMAAGHRDEGTMSVCMAAGHRDDGDDGGMGVCTAAGPQKKLTHHRSASRQRGGYDPDTR